VNPEDGKIYAATYRGLYRVEGLNKAFRVAGSSQTNTGFTVTGPDQFISSGRPDLLALIDGTEPAMMGFQLSTDAGRTWRSLSFKREGTFSQIVVAGDLVYGFEASTRLLMVSRDGGSNWQKLSSLPDLSDLADSPYDSARLLALTEMGAGLISVDGGTSWESIAWPPLAQIEWGDRLWGTDPEGQLYESADGGVNWLPVGKLPGQPTAFFVQGSVMYAAMRQDGIYVSTNDGLSWQARYLLPEKAADPASDQ
jgi:photosystem II stability/assembly factor-like uncharacterized protein